MLKLKFSRAPSPWEMELSMSAPVSYVQSPLCEVCSVLLLLLSSVFFKLSYCLMSIVQSFIPNVFCTLSNVFCALYFCALLSIHITWPSTVCYSFESIKIKASESQASKNSVAYICSSDASLDIRNNWHVQSRAGWGPNGVITVREK